MEDIIAIFLLLCAVAGGVRVLFSKAGLIVYPLLGICWYLSENYTGKVSTTAFIVAFLLVSYVLLKGLSVIGGGE